VDVIGGALGATGLAAGGGSIEDAGATRSIRATRGRGVAMASTGVTTAGRISGIGPVACAS